MVELARLESVCTCKGTEGSNPSPSAEKPFKSKDLEGFTISGKSTSRPYPSRYFHISKQENIYNSKANSQTFRVSEQTFRVSEQTFRASEQTFRVSEQTFRVSEQTFRVTETTFRVTETTFRVTEITFRVTETTFRVTEITFRVTGMLNLDKISIEILNFFVR